MYDQYQIEIISEITSDNCVLFIGSGLSIGSGVPSWRQLIEPLAQQIECPMNYDFLTIAQAYENKFGRSSLLKRICEASNTTGKTPTKVHELLLELGVNIWITTNYDNLLEKTLENAYILCNPIVSSEHITIAAGNQIKLIKLHGCRNFPDEIIITKNDYFTSHLKKRVIWDMLKAELLQKTFLFLGYSGSDPDFNQVQAQTQYDLGLENFRKSYIVMFGCNEIMRADLESRNVTIIDLGDKEGDGATNALFEFLNEMVAKLSHIPGVALEYHDSIEAKKLVPAEIQEALRQLNCELICCLESCIYNKVTDDRDFFIVQRRPCLPSKYRSHEYVCLLYTRHDESFTNIWVGWAIGKKI